MSSMQNEIGYEYVFTFRDEGTPRARAADAAVRDSVDRTSAALREQGTVAGQAARAGADAAQRTAQTALQAATQVVRAQVQQRAEMMETARAYTALADAATKGSEEQVVAAGLAKKALQQLGLEYTAAADAAEVSSARQLGAWARLRAGAATTASSIAASFRAATAAQAGAAGAAGGHGAAGHASASETGFLRGATRESGIGRAIGYVGSAAIGGAVAGYGAKEILAAAKDEQVALALVQVAARNAGLAWAGHREEVEKNAASMARLGGFVQADVLTGMATLLRVTKNVDTATTDETAAINLARARHIDLSSAVGLVVKAQQGHVQLLRRIGIDIQPVTRAEDMLRDSHAKTTSAVRAQAKAYDLQQSAIKGIAALQQQYGGAAAAYGQTAAGAAARLNVAWDRLEVTLARQLDPAIAGLLQHMTQYITHANDTGSVTRAMHTAMAGLTTAAHAASAVIHAVDAATGGFKNTLLLLLGLKMASVIGGWTASLGKFIGGPGAGVEGAEGRTAGLLQNLRGLAKMATMTIGITLLINGMQTPGMKGFFEQLFGAGAVGWAMGGPAGAAVTLTADLLYQVLKRPAASDPSNPQSPDYTYTVGRYRGYGVAVKGAPGDTAVGTILQKIDQGQKVNAAQQAILMAYIRQNLGTLAFAPSARLPGTNTTVSGWQAVLKTFQDSNVFNLVTNPGGRGGAVAPARGAGTNDAGAAAGKSKLLNFAQRALGAPYLWGGSGPNSFDCSGLVMWAFANGLNIQLPHSTYAQVAMGHAVSAAKAQIGDVVFTNYGESGNAGPGHEGLIVGFSGGQPVIEAAPHKGATVTTYTGLRAFTGGGRYQIRDLGANFGTGAGGAGVGGDTGSSGAVPAAVAAAAAAARAAAARKAALAAEKKAHAAAVKHLAAIEKEAADIQRLATAQAHTAGGGLQATEQQETAYGRAIVVLQQAEQYARSHGLSASAQDITARIAAIRGALKGLDTHITSLFQKHVQGLQKQAQQLVQQAEAAAKASGDPTGVATAQREVKDFQQAIADLQRALVYAQGHGLNNLAASIKTQITNLHSQITGTLEKAYTTTAQAVVSAAEAADKAAADPAGATATSALVRQLQRAIATLQRGVAYAHAHGLTAMASALTTQLNDDQAKITAAYQARLDEWLKSIPDAAGAGQQAMTTATNMLGVEGISSSSSAGYSIQATIAQGVLASLQAEQKQLEAALQYAVQHNLTDSATQIRQQLADLANTIGDTASQLATDLNQAVSQMAQEAVDHASALVQHAQAGLDQMIAQQPYADTSTVAGLQQAAANMRQQAGYITGTQVPALQAQLGAYNSQLGTLSSQQATGNAAAKYQVANQAADMIMRVGMQGAVQWQQQQDAAIDSAAQQAVDQITGNIDSVTTQILQAQQQAADDLRQAAQYAKQAAELAAQQVVDMATHQETLAETGLTTLQLQQQLQGQQYIGGQWVAGDQTPVALQAQASYITNTVIPDVQATLLALQQQLQVAQDQGDTTLANQIAEAIADKQNTILQDQVTAMNDVAANTQQMVDQLKDFGGTTGFVYGDQLFTDNLVGV